MGTWHSRIIFSFFGVLLCAPVTAQVTQRVSVSSGGVQGNDDSQDATVSADGRYVAFYSVGSNLVSGDTNGSIDVFVRDRQTGATERVSVASGGTQANGHSVHPSISDDGRYVAFTSLATNLVAGDTNNNPDVFVHDRQLGTTLRLSVDSGGVQVNKGGYNPSISADGRYVAFETDASSLASGDTNGDKDVFVHDRQTGVTECVSLQSSGVPGNGESEAASISADGRYVAFQSFATDLVSGDTNGNLDVFVRDRQSGATERVSVDSGGVQANNLSIFSSISADGRYVAFASYASNLVSGDSGGSLDVFVRDRQSGATVRVSVDPNGAQANGDSDFPSISADGRYVAFKSFASNLVSGDANGSFGRDVFVHDRQTGKTELVDVDSSGAQGNGTGNERDSFGPSISEDGRYVAFENLATNLVPADTNGRSDIFVRDRIGGTTFTSLCDPGVGGVQACPCSNPPTGPGRGCDNSAATGGATLSASGGTFLSSDSLVFTTSGERPTALSTVWQGPATPATGIVYGQGVRCVNGSLKRLYSKAAVGGSITAPNFGAGDLSVSARSAALGAPIPSGTSRYYFVSYRDPTVLGGCPSGSTFNATQTGMVGWSP